MDDSNDSPDTGEGTVVPFPARPCPGCGRPAAYRFRPFCSKRCADLDLGSWFSESYAVPAEEGQTYPGEDEDAD